MPNEMREKLIELIVNANTCDSHECKICAKDDACCDYCYAEKLADHLIENGVILLPCKVGDKYWVVDKYCNTDPYETEKEIVKPWDCERYCGRSDCSFKEYRINEHIIPSLQFIVHHLNCFCETIYPSREAAEKKLEEMKND